MLKYTLILPFFLIALVFTRANVFAQQDGGSIQKVERRHDGVNETFLRKCLDSLMWAKTRIDLNGYRVKFDPIDSSVFHPYFLNSAKITVGTLYVYNLAGYTKDLEYAELNYVSASVRLTFDDPSKKAEEFSFSKLDTSKYDCTLYVPESPSFWDSTAKPILVTLGAVAVIALFFLIRG